MLNHRVYLDCDGVFADFVSGILQALGYPEEYDINKWPWGRVFDIFPLIGTDWKEASSHCTSDFWANLPWMSDGKEIYHEIFTRFNVAETMLLTKPMDNDESYTGKARWVTEHMPSMRRRMIPTHVPKQELAFGFNCLLLDDSQQNIDAFIAFGGAGILVPRPWNVNDHVFFAGDTVKYIGEMLDRWIDITDHPAKNRRNRTCLK
jgi:5'(3')-deoxyribonucleotidase